MISKKERHILAIAAMCLAVGLIIAYYNTSSLGYDNANIISFNSEQLNIFDYEIKFSEVREKYNKLKEFIPDEIIVI